MRLRVRGVDGSVWDLLDPKSPVTLTGGIRGLHVPTVSGIWSESASSDTRRRRGRSVEPRRVTMRVSVVDLVKPYRSGDAWRTADARWWDALGGGEMPFLLEVDLERLDALGRPDVRTLTLWDESEDDVIDADPAGSGAQDYLVQASPESPYWAGPEVTASFIYNPGADVNYYGGASGLGPPFYIGGGSQFANATISNPGQTDGWLRWALTAPFSSASVGVGGDTIPLPFAQVASQRVLIDTDPRRRSITDGAGNNLWPLIGPGLDPLFTPVSPGMAVPLSIVLDNPAAGSRVDVALTPEYKRALS